MKKTMLFAIPTVLIALTGCGITQPANNVPVPASNTKITFFKNVPKPYLSITLKPDPLVLQRLPDVKSPNDRVIVDLPVYPGAISASPDNRISDMGTPMNGDLLDGTLYFESKDSESQIVSWYKEQFKKFGYQISGSGQSGKIGQPISRFYEISKAGMPGDPTKSPNISLGFLIPKQHGETIFKLKAYYIAVPPRPVDSYLPNEIVKVVLTDGKQNKTITDRQWIDNVVSMFNGLQMQTPGIQAGGPNVGSNTIHTIDASFVEKSGKVIPVKFVVPYGSTTIGGTSLDDTIALTKAIQSKFTS